MLEFLEGRVEEKRADGAVIRVGGIGFFVHLSSQSLKALPSRGEMARVFLHLLLREDGATLYGFTTPLEREMFQHLLSVNGVGPRVAMGILSAYRPEQLLRIVASGDVESLTAVSGVGKKYAQRIVLELKDRMAGMVSGAEMPRGGEGTDLLREVAEALRQLGYTPGEVAEALNKVPVASEEEGTITVEEVLKSALRVLGKGSNRG
ncbi:MAG: Holliday junction branch migration protein RuvA [Candidatus Geothermincolales bacterium]